MTTFTREQVEVLLKTIETSIQRIDALNGYVSQLESTLLTIGHRAHDHSTGPAVPDTLWEIRTLAYDAVSDVSIVDDDLTETLTSFTNALTTAASPEPEDRDDASTPPPPAAPSAEVLSSLTPGTRLYARDPVRYHTLAGHPFRTSPQAYWLELLEIGSLTAMYNSFFVVDDVVHQFSNGRVAVLNDILYELAESHLVFDAPAYLLNGPVITYVCHTRVQ